VTSKYDSYWVARLAEIRAAVAAAASGQPAALRLAGLTLLGDRQSWQGVAEVRCGDVTRSSMAHATSLAKTVAASGVCMPWPQSTFRFAITTSGDTLTISAAEERQVVEQASQAAIRPEHAPPDSATRDFRATAPTTGKAKAEADDHQMADMGTTGRFYLALERLAEILHGPRFLHEARASDGWPRHGVYFFYEPGEVRADGRDRIVRVGTHALTAASRASLWARLRQHRGPIAGSRPGGGNHRASVFRRHVGAALIRRDQLGRELLDSWLDRHGPRPGFVAQEAHLEQAVSRHIGTMPFLWLAIPDATSRGYVERNSIALTSRLAQGLDAPSTSWLGHHADRPEISRSGLWNVEHVHHRCDPGFLDVFEELAERKQ
jgi:hypothetical protein